MTEAVFDFKDIKRRMDRKPAPVVVPPEIAAALDWTQELTKLWDIPGFQDAMAGYVNPLRDYLDNNETVFIGWDVGVVKQ